MEAKDLERIAGKIAGTTGTVRTAGKIEFIRDQGPLRRDIRAPGFQWSPESFNDLAKILWAAQRAQSFTMAALRIFSKMPSSQFSPDGLLGGRGYIQAVKDMRTTLSQAGEILSTFTDTVHDEINAEHWKPAETPEANEFVQDAQDVKSNPEAFVDSQYEEVRGEEGDIEDPLGNPSPDDYNPEFDADAAETEDGEGEDGEEGESATASPHGSFWLKGEQFKFGNDGALKDEPDYGTDPKRPGSKLPKDTADQKQGKTEAEMTMNTTTMDHGSYASAVKKAVRSFAASSALPNQGPSPVVDHIGPGASGTDAGHFNWDALWPSDDPSGEGLHSGVNESDYLLDAGTGDGVTGDDNPTDGDSTVLQLAHDGYSWLPGSRNEKNLPYYDLGLTEEDVDWLVAHSDPDPVDKPVVEKPKFNNLWDAELV